ncbi:MAG: DUF4149 domain-containing protein [Magnetovibrionaceae bacterium]
MTLAVLMWLCLIVISGLLVSMIFFAAVVAPSVFHFLDEAPAGRFLRGFFPRYYIFGIGMSLAPAVLLSVLQRPFESWAMILIAAGFLFSRQYLTPRINEARDKAQAGDETSAHRFKTLHKLSVVVNLVQMVVLVGILVRVGPFGL